MGAKWDWEKLQRAAFFFQYHCFKAGGEWVSFRRSEWRKPRAEEIHKEKKTILRTGFLSSMQILLASQSHWSAYPETDSKCKKRDDYCVELQMKSCGKWNLFTELNKSSVSIETTNISETQYEKNAISFQLHFYIGQIRRSFNVL